MSSIMSSIAAFALFSMESLQFVLLRIRILAYGLSTLQTAMADGGMLSAISSTTRSPVFRWAGFFEIYL